MGLLHPNQADSRRPEAIFAIGISMWLELSSRKEKHQFCSETDYVLKTRQGLRRTYSR
jgi:hypothetical protein